MHQLWLSAVQVGLRRLPRVRNRDPVGYISMHLSLFGTHAEEHWCSHGFTLKYGLRWHE